MRVKGEFTVSARTIESGEISERNLIKRYIPSLTMIEYSVTKNPESEPEYTSCSGGVKSRHKGKMLPPTYTVKFSGVLDASK